MKHHKNKKFIDPRYFMDEKVDDEATTSNQLDEASMLDKFKGAMVGWKGAGEEKAAEEPEVSAEPEMSAQDKTRADIRFKVRARKFRDESEYLLQQLGILKQIRPAMKAAEAVKLLSSENEALYGHELDQVITLISKEAEKVEDRQQQLGEAEETAGKGSEGAFTHGDDIVYTHSLKNAKDVARLRHHTRIGNDTARDIARYFAGSRGWLTQAHTLTKKWLDEYDELLSDEGKQGLAQWMEQLEEMGRDIRKRLESGWDQQIFEGKTRKLIK